MDALFTFHYGDSLTTINLYKVFITYENNGQVCISERGVGDAGANWYLSNEGDKELLRSWLVGNSIGGESFVRSE